MRLTARAYAAFTKGASLPPSRKKYGNVPVHLDGMRFDSKREAKCWQDLQIRQTLGEISGLERQVTFDLTVNGFHVCAYRADFVWVEHGQRVVADAKGAKTATYLLKKKLMQAIYRIQIVEL